MSSERRSHVRTKPTPELPARAIRAIDSLVQESLTILDISVGGLALLDVKAEPFSRMRLTLSLAQHGDHAVDVEVRWASRSGVGVAFVDLTPAARQAVQRYVAELLERGAAV